MAHLTFSHLGPGLQSFLFSLEFLISFLFFLLRIMMCLVHIFKFIQVRNSMSRAWNTLFSSPSNPFLEFSGLLLSSLGLFSWKAAESHPKTLFHLLHLWASSPRFQDPVSSSWLFVYLTIYFAGLCPQVTSATKHFLSPLWMWLWLRQFLRLIRLSHVTFYSLLLYVLNFSYLL